MADRTWRSTQVFAWTEGDGPGRAPRPPATWMWTTTAATLGVVFSVIFVTDTLCPEHRAWVQNLATLALVGVVVSIVGLVRGWAVAPLLTVASAGLGAVIGLIDAVHAPVRGGAIAVGFGLAVLFGAWLALRQLPLAAWDRAVRRQVTPDDLAPPRADHLAVPAAEVAPELVRDTALEPAPEAHSRR